MPFIVSQAGAGGVLTHSLLGLHHPGEKNSEEVGALAFSEGDKGANRVRASPPDGDGASPVLLLAGTITARTPPAYSSFFQ